MKYGNKPIQGRAGTGNITPPSRAGMGNFKERTVACKIPPVKHSNQLGGAVQSPPGTVKNK